jgi:hypothetical protein
MADTPGSQDEQPRGAAATSPLTELARDLPTHPDFSRNFVNRRGGQCWDAASFIRWTCTTRTTRRHIRLCSTSSRMSSWRTNTTFAGSFAKLL